MRIEPVLGVGLNTRAVMMELWQLSMNKRLFYNTRQKINRQARYLSQDIMVNSIGSENVNSRSRPPSVIPVEPAVKVSISLEARNKI